MIYKDEFCELVKEKLAQIDATLANIQGGTQTDRLKIQRFLRRGRKRWEKIHKEICE